MKDQRSAVMNISVNTLSKRLPEVMEALDKNERVTLSHAGRRIALLRLVSDAEDEERRLMADPGFGMWADREDMKDPSAWVHEKRARHRERLFGIGSGERK
jgi:hypothetical protein